MDSPMRSATVAAALDNDPYVRSGTEEQARRWGAVCDPTALTAQQTRPGSTRPGASN